MAFLSPLVRVTLFLGSTVLLFASGCQNLDKDGGYINEKTNRYVYVRPKNIAPKDYKTAVRQPRPGEPQTIRAKVASIDDDLKSLWLLISDRPSYQLLAETMSKGNRDDRNKRLRVILKFVSPIGSVEKPSFRKRWVVYVKKRMKAQLLGQYVLAEIHFQGKSKQLQAYVSQMVVNGKGKRVIRNVNQWMIFEGLSYFFLQDASAAQIKSYSRAQSLAKERRSGLWKYQ